MANLTSTQQEAFDTLLSLLQTAGAAQNPAVEVFDSELVQYEPATYVMLTGLENHHFDWAALGQFPFYETYDITGIATVFQGDVDPKGVRDATFSLYENVVQTTVVANSGSWATQNGYVLSPSLMTAGLYMIVPTYVRYSSGPAEMASGESGYSGTIEFAYTLKARITAK